MIISVRREVIVAGGSLGSPKILLHSGVGPKDVLDAACVPLKPELPGVGQHLQDHMVSGVHAVISSLGLTNRRVVWQTPLETAGDINYSQSNFSVRMLLPICYKCPHNNHTENSRVSIVHQRHSRLCHQFRSFRVHQRLRYVPSYSPSSFGRLHKRSCANSVPGGRERVQSGV